jgi:beta-glucosidase
MKKAGIDRLSLLCLILISLLFVSCKSQTPEPAKQTEKVEQAPAIKGFKAFDARAKEILSQMTLDEKIGQMTQPEQDKVLGNEGDMQKYFIGSVLSGGDSDPVKDNSLIEWTNLYDRVQEEALKTRLKIPALYGIDAVHGHSNVLGAVMFPHNIALGCTRDPELAERIGRITAKEMRATGIHWTFAPAVTVPQDIRWGRTYEGFSEDPEIVKVLGKAMVMGLQGNDLSDPLSVVACAKHYIGDGGTEATKAPRPGFPGGDVTRMWLDQGDTKVDESTLRRIHLPGYIAAIEAGVGTIMPSYSTWNGERCSGSKRLLTEILKEELGFDGFLISDYNAIRQINPMNLKESIMISINAGMDMAMEPGGYREFFDTLKALVEEGSVPIARIDDAVTRILRVKLAMGLMDDARNHKADRTLHNAFGSPEHRAVAREAVRKSLVLLKNDNGALPIPKTSTRIHVAGKSADNIGNQCGGWTIRWQGQTGEVTPGGTTVLQAVKQAVSESTLVTYSPDGTGAEGATLGIAVVGELPYAEGVGDREDLSLDAGDVATINNLKKAGIPVVVIIISGRPMIVNDILSQADALVAAFLPGTEGQGITDVLFGDFSPTGKLSFSWPRANEDLPMNINMPKEKYNPLFPIGFGLGY